MIEPILHGYLDFLRKTISGDMLQYQLNPTPLSLALNQDTFFDFSKNNFPNRRFFVSTFFAPTLKTAIEIYLKDDFFQTDFTKISGLIAFPLLDTCLKLICENHFTEGGEGLILSCDYPKLKKEKGAFISSISQLSEIYFNEYSGPLRDDLFNLDKDWRTRESTIGIPDPKNLFQRIQDYRNASLHSLMTSHHFNHIALLLTAYMYGFKNNYSVT